MKPVDMTNTCEKQHGSARHSTKSQTSHAPDTAHDVDWLRHPPLCFAQRTLSRCSIRRHVFAYKTHRESKQAKSSLLLTRRRGWVQRYSRCHRWTDCPHSVTATSRSIEPTGRTIALFEHLRPTRPIHIRTEGSLLMMNRNKTIADVARLTRSHCQMGSSSLAM